MCFFWGGDIYLLLLPAVAALGLLAQALDALTDALSVLLLLLLAHLLHLLVDLLQGLLALQIWCKKPGV